jgi:hypothetical protein
MREKLPLQDFSDQMFKKVEVIISNLDNFDKKINILLC